MGRLITVVIMIFGVTLFLNLARVPFNPTKVRFSGPDCGLQRHHRDAVHCKPCGRLLNIPDEGADHSDLGSAGPYRSFSRSSSSSLLP